MPVFHKIHYAWIVVGVTCLALLTGAGVRSTPGILMVPLEQEFHWSRATIALAVSINLILYGCIGPFAAAIMERFGIRRSVMAALALVACGVASTSLMQYEWQTVDMKQYPNVLRWYLAIANKPATQKGYKVPKDVGEVPIPK